jgi:hypothetical protein
MDSRSGLYYFFDAMSLICFIAIFVWGSFDQIRAHESMCADCDDIQCDCKRALQRSRLSGDDAGESGASRFFPRMQAKLT